MLCVICSVLGLLHLLNFIFIAMLCGKNQAGWCWGDGSWAYAGATAGVSLRTPQLHLHLSHSSENRKSSAPHTPSGRNKMSECYSLRVTDWFPLHAQRLWNLIYFDLSRPCDRIQHFFLWLHKPVMWLMWKFFRSNGWAFELVNYQINTVKNCEHY